MRRILIVDDEPTLVEGLCEMLEGRFEDRAEVFRAYSGTEALATLTDASFDLIVTDIHMPGLSGVDLIERVHTLRRECLIIVLTGYEEFSVIHRAVNLGVSAFLLKGESDDAFLDAVQNALSELDVRDEQDRARVRQRQQSEAFGRLVRKHYLYSLLGVWAAPVDPPAQGLNFDPSRDAMLLIARLEPGPELAGFAALEEALEDAFSAHLRLEIELISGFDAACILQPIEAEPGSFPLRDDDERQRYLRSGLESVQKRLSAAGQDVSMAYQPMAVHASELERQANLLRALLTSLCPRRGDIQVIDASRSGERIRARLDAERSVDRVERVAEALRDGDEIALSAVLERMIDEGELNPRVALRLLSVLVGAADAYGLSSPSEDELPMLLLSDGQYELLRDAALRLCAQRRSSAERSSTQVVEAIHEYIRDHLGDRTLSLISIAAEMHYNPSYLSRFYKQATRQNLIDTINQMRFQKACALISDTDYRFTRIAHLVGFDSPSYFSTFFKRRSGKTPNEYRASILESR